MRGQKLAYIQNYIHSCNHFRHLIQVAFTATMCFLLFGYFTFVSPIQIAPLHLAAECGHDVIVELLLEKGAPADTEDHTKV